MAATGLSLFGVTLSRDKSITKEIPPTEQHLVVPQKDDGAIVLQSGGYYATYVDLEGITRNEIELITRYREMSLQAELEAAIDDVVNEAIVRDDNNEIVRVSFDEDKVPEPVQKKIEHEFDTILKLFNFHYTADETFRRWYIDGRLFYHIVLDSADPDSGIKELKYIDPRKIKKIREIQKERDPRTGADIVTKINEYYVYSDVLIPGATFVNDGRNVRVAPDSIINVNSGLADSKGAMVLSYLHKAIKPLNNLRMVEDSTLIYMYARAPEKRAWYVDVGNLPKQKGEQYLYDFMMKHRNKIVYDTNTGELKDERKHMSMLEDYFIPRRGEGKATEIVPIQGASNMQQMNDIVRMFQQKLYRALGIPVARIDAEESGGALLGVGRTTEVTREELKFARFIDKLRNKFSGMFEQALRVQCILKKICTDDEWKEIKQVMHFEFLKDNNFEELREGELLRERLMTLAQVEPYMGIYFSKEHVQKKVLRMDDDQIKEMQEQIDAEKQMAEETGDESLTGKLPPPPMDPSMMGQDGGMPQGPLDSGQPSQPPAQGDPNTNFASFFPPDQNDPQAGRSSTGAKKKSKPDPTKS